MFDRHSQPAATKVFPRFQRIIGKGRQAVNESLRLNEEGTVAFNRQVRQSVGEALEIGASLLLDWRPTMSYRAGTAP